MTLNEFVELVNERGGGGASELWYDDRNYPGHFRVMDENDFDVIADGRITFQSVQFADLD